MRERELSKINMALAAVSKNKDAKRIMLSALGEIESILTVLDFDSRPEIIWPILDCLYGDNSLLQKKVRIDPKLPLLTFQFYYSSQIARGIVLSKPEISDHIWEPQTTKLLLHLCERATRVAIGGAYAGDHALLVAQKLQFDNSKNRTEIHCFEMDQNQLSLCQSNAEINGLSNLIYHHAGLYSRDDIGLKLVGTDALCHAEVVPRGAPGSIAAVTIDKIVIEHEIGGFDVIMLDIEGGELNALKGCLTLLSKLSEEAPDIIFEVHRSYVDWSGGLENTEIIKFLKHFGYYVFAIRDYQDNVDLSAYPIELIPPDKCVLDGPPHGFNMVAVKDIKRLRGPMFHYVENVSPKLLRHRDPRLHAPMRS